MEAVEVAPGGTTLSSVVDLARRLVRGRRASLMLPDDGRDELRVVAASGLAAEARGAHVRVGDPISGLVAQCGQPLLVNQLVPQTVVRATRYTTGSFISVPVPIGETQVGVLNVADPQDGPFRVDDLLALRTL